MEKLKDIFSFIMKTCPKTALYCITFRLNISLFCPNLSYIFTKICPNLLTNWQKNWLGGLKSQLYLFFQLSFRIFEVVTRNFRYLHHRNRIFLIWKTTPCLSLIFFGFFGRKSYNPTKSLHTSVGLQITIHFGRLVQLYWVNP